MVQKPIDANGWPDRYPAKEHCSKCGLCETSYVSHISDARAFLDDGMARIDAAEERVHGRRWDLSGMVLSLDERQPSSSPAASFSLSFICI